MLNLQHGGEKFDFPPLGERRRFLFAVFPPGVKGDAQVMKEGRVDAVLVGSDRIAANGDAANKIGTYGLALAAHAHGVPFYVLAPTTTFDLSIESGDGIPIEHRDGTEVTHGFGRQTAPDGVQVYSPAFDVTPAKLIAAIVCENGIARPPYKESLRKLLG